jgi:hypothetical protein
MSEHERRMVFARQEAAKAWCDKRTEKKIMDPDLAEVFAEILVVHMYEPHMGCATTGEMLEEIMARVDVNYKSMNGDE